MGRGSPKTRQERSSLSRRAFGEGSTARGILYGPTFKRPQPSLITFSPGSAAQEHIQELIEKIRQGDLAPTFDLLQEHRALISETPRPPLLQALLEELAKPSLHKCYAEVLDLDTDIVRRLDFAPKGVNADYQQLLEHGATRIQQFLRNTSALVDNPVQYLDLGDYLPTSYNLPDVANPKNFPTLAIQRTYQLFDKHDFKAFLPEELKVLGTSKINGQEPNAIFHLRQQAIEQSVIVLENQLRSKFNTLGWATRNSQHVVSVNSPVRSNPDERLHLRGGPAKTTACELYPLNANSVVAAERGAWTKALLVRGGHGYCAECLKANPNKPDELDESSTSYPVLSPAARAVLKTEVQQVWENVWGQGKTGTPPESLGALVRSTFSEALISAVFSEITIERKFSEVVAAILEGARLTVGPEDWKKKWQEGLDSWALSPQEQRRFVAEGLIKKNLQQVKAELFKALLLNA